MIAPLVRLPIDMKALESDVLERERMLELLARREVADRALKEKGVELPERSLTTQAVIKAVAGRYGVSAADIQGECRAKETTHARHEVFYLLAQQTKADGAPRLSMVQIGLRVASSDRRPFDHTTVRNGIVRHTERLAEAINPGAPKAKKRPVTGEAARKARANILNLPRAPVTVCLQPADGLCDWCRAAAGEACNVGARRG